MLQSLLADCDRTLDLNASAQQTRLPVHLVTRQRTIPAPDAEVHIHDENVRAVDDSGRDFFFGCFERVEVGKCFDGEWQSAAGSCECRKSGYELPAEFRFI